MPSDTLYSDLKPVFNDSLIQALEIRDTIQHFLDDKNLVKNRSSLTTQRILDYSKHKPVGKKIELPEIIGLLRSWSLLLFKYKVTNDILWEEEDSDYYFGLNDEKRILRYGDLVALLKKALEISQTIIDIVYSKPEEEVRTTQEPVHNDEPPAGGAAEIAPLSIPKVSKKDEEEKSSPKIESDTQEKIDNLKAISSSIRREQLRIQQSVLLAISSETGIPIGDVQKMLSSDVSRLASASIYDLSTQELGDSLLNVTKKMQIYRDILRNPILIAKTQELIKQHGTKANQTTPQSVLTSIEKEEEVLVKTQEYKEQVEVLKASTPQGIPLSLPTKQYEQLISEILSKSGIPESDVAQVLSRVKAYSIARKNIDPSNWDGVESLLLPILGESGYNKAVLVFGNAEELGEVFQLLITKRQKDWRDKVSQVAILHSSTDIPVELTDEISQLIYEYGEEAVGYAFYFSKNQITDKHQYYKDLLSREKGSIYEKEIQALQKAAELQSLLVSQAQENTNNTYARKVFNQYLHANLSTDQSFVDLQQQAYTDDSIFYIPNGDVGAYELLDWESISDTPFAEQETITVETPPEVFWDHLQYNLASSTQARTQNLSAKHSQLRTALSVATKAKKVADAANKAKVIATIVKATITFILPMLPYILLGLGALTLALSIIGALKSLAPKTTTVASTHAKDAFSNISTKASQSVKSIGSGAKKALFSRPINTNVAPSTPITLSNIFSQLSTITTPVVAGTTAVGSILGATIIYSNIQSSSFLMNMNGGVETESQYIEVIKSASSPEIDFDNKATKHLPNKAAEDSVPILYKITIKPQKGATLKSVSFTDTTKVVSKGPNYNDTVNPPVYDIITRTGDQVPFIDAEPEIVNGEMFPSGESSITITPDQEYVIAYTIKLNPSYVDSLLTNTFRMKATVELSGKDGTTTQEEETGTSLTIRIGNPPELPGVQYAKSLAQAIYDNDPDKTPDTSLADVKLADFDNGLTQGLINDGFENVVGTLRRSASYSALYPYLQCVGFVRAIQEGIGYTLPGVEEAQLYASVEVPGYTFHPIEDYPSNDSAPVPGDLAIMTGGSAGHIGFISEVSSPEDTSSPYFFRIIDANWNFKGMVRGSNEIPESRLYASNAAIDGLRYAGFLRKD